MSEAAAVVFVVDDDPSVRRAIKRLVESVGLRVELFGSAQEFLRSERPDLPNCLVLDIRLPGMSGLDFQRELAVAGIPIPIIFITAHGDIPMTVRAMKAGAVEFLTKPFRDQDLLDAIGRPNKQIAAEIGTSEATVKVHRSQLMRKMAADSLPELVRMSEKIGIALVQSDQSSRR